MDHINLQVLGHRIDYAGWCIIYERVIFSTKGTELFNYTSGEQEIYFSLRKVINYFTHRYMVGTLTRRI